MDVETMIKEAKAYLLTGYKLKYVQLLCGLTGISITEANKLTKNMQTKEVIKAKQREQNQLDNKFKWFKGEK